ncbi:hypothetical protein K435DRAFT_272433 [Dendrothele bispora CBS 962.96]|uniref:Uncharacterized protein n=1 Tax=Dendrothele bispora (strain CBS 962.96) TaxID=1314807 RepID=A0A4S8LMZ9_DENBC|nr:hypothetical protein K435DRAFT_272433 [Dendrothele bispora CBS 962.96]
MSHMNPSTDRTCRPEKPVKGGLITIVKCLRKTLPKVVRGQVSSAPNISTSDSSITASVSITNDRLLHRQVFLRPSYMQDPPVVMSPTAN